MASRRAPCRSCSRSTAPYSLLDLHKKLAAATIPADKKLYQRQIEATNAEIDALVYELYGLTEEEIGIVEGRDA
jgi:hypothetical protein